MFSLHERNGVYKPRGTAFFASVPIEQGPPNSGYTYLITAKHCIERARLYEPSLFIRLNTKSGTTRHVEVTNANWLYRDTEGTDVAVLPFDVASDIEFAAIPLEMMATDEIISEKQINAGDDVVITGLFTKHSGRSRNVPVLRAGIISAMPGEPLIGDDGNEYKAYLIEMRSTGGLSGSPVFVVKTWADPKNKTKRLGLQLFSSVFYLVGLIRGHWNEKNSAADIADDDQEGAETFNTGIAIATPSQECIHLLNEETLVKQRKQADLEWRKKNAPAEDFSGKDTP